MRHTANGTPLLVGYIATTDSEYDLGNARTLLAETLPAALVPRLVRVDELPVRTSGKCDRDALPWPPPESSGPDYDEAGDDIVAPLDEVEAALARIWCETVGLGVVSAESHFFDIGGDSLSATRVSILAREPAIG